MGGKTELSLRLRTATGGGWLHVSWHPVAARVCSSASAPTRGSSAGLRSLHTRRLTPCDFSLVLPPAESFTLGEQMHNNLSGLVLLGAVMPQVGWSTQWASGKRLPDHLWSSFPFASGLGKGDPAAVWSQAR